VRSESFSNGSYTGLFEFAAPGPQAGAAEPQAAPPQARTSSRPAWILIVPAEIGMDDNIRWGRDSAWSRTWIAPQRRAGMRLIATMGDADDHDRLPVSLLRDPMSGRTASAAGSLGRKYGAPAIALVLRDTRDSSVSAWVWRGGDASSADGGTAESEAASKDLALDALVSLAAPGAASAPRSAQRSEEGRSAWVAQHDEGRSSWTGNNNEGAGAWTGAAEPPTRVDEPPARLRPDITLDVDTSAAGRISFSLRLDSADQGTQTAVRRGVRNIVGLWMSTVHQDEDGLEITGQWTGDGGRDGLVRAFAQAGLAAR
jgi:hypothetical protein